MTRRLVLPSVLTQREAATALETMVAAAAAAEAASAGAASRPVSFHSASQAAPGSPATGLVRSCWSVDASTLTDFDSSALAVLMACKRIAAAADCALVIDSPPAKLVRLAGLYGLDQVLLGEAIAAQDAADLTA